MNRRQQERVADLGRVFERIYNFLANLFSKVTREQMATRPQDVASIKEMYQEQPIQNPVDLNGKLAQYEVYIKHVHNGFVVSVGCQTFVFETFDKLSKYMKMYYEDPQGTYEKHYKGELLK